jgi:glutamyl-tRNA synthetase
MIKPVRVRFAPSPTGPLHIGGVRTALFNYLFAKKNNGVFYIRIEDTDQTRYVAEAENYIMESLKWLGISADETVGVNERFGPYRQSERKKIYKEYAQRLIDTGWAYYAFDTAESLDNLRKEQEADGKTFIYNHQNRNKLDTSLVLNEEQLKTKLDSGATYVLRFKTPTNEILVLNDMIRGEVRFDTNLLDDKILFKSDGMPTYHLANIIDDHLMETSHVIRGEEWLPSMPLHILLYRAFGWEAPEFAHLPLILKPIGNGKLSKRDGDKLGFPVFPLQWETENGLTKGYRETGFLPEAVVNFLALLGWNDGTDQEIYSLEELVEKFDLSKVNKSGAKFDPEKNKWFNHQYLQKVSENTLAVEFNKILIEKGIKEYNQNKVEIIVGLVKERANFTSDLWDLSNYFFEAPTSYNEKALKNWKEETSGYMQNVIDILEENQDWNSETIETEIKKWITQNEIGMGKIMQPLRLSIVGELKGPDLFKIIEIIGKDEIIRRIKTAIKNN